MKKFYGLMILGLIAGQAIAGGILTNTNQSAQFVRMLSRNASTDIDAVYFNPAGVMRMDEGFYVAVHNQTLFQTKTIVNSYNGLNNHTYQGDVVVPFFPNIYAVYKVNKFAFSLGFGPNAGGGTAEYKTGLPRFELPISQLPLALTASGINTTQYSADIKFEGSSIFLGTQFNFSYEITPEVSVSAGIRLINATNKYNGYIRNVMINPNHPYNPAGAGNMVSAPLFFNTLAAAATSASESLQTLIDLNAGSYTLDQLVGAGYITQSQADQLAGGLGSNYNSTYDVNTLQTIYNIQANSLSDQAENTSDMEVDVKQTGTGITPIFGVNCSLLDNKLDLAIKYEFITKLVLKNNTKVDDSGQYPDGAKYRSDIPAILAFGARYSVLDNFRVSLSLNHYFDKNANWDGKEKLVDKNLYEIALGAEFDVSEMISLSCGYQYGQTGVGQGYQTDISYSLSSNTVGFGGTINLNKKLSVDLGAMYTMYTSDEVNKTTAAPCPVVGLPYVETYDKKNLGFAIGINYKF